MFCKAMNFTPDIPSSRYKRWAVWSLGYSTADGFVWQMLPEVATALEKLLWVTPEPGDRDNANHNVDYMPQEGDRRQVVERQIRERRGQPQFRDALCQRYGNRCLVTGSEVLAV